MNRPKALHSLTYNVRGDQSPVARMGERPNNQLVLIDRHTEGAAGAGGDIRMLADSAAQDDVKRRARSSSKNITLNHQLFTYKYRSSPLWMASRWAAVSASITGAGTGVTTENTRLAMPGLASGCSRMSAAAGISPPAGQMGKIPCIDWRATQGAVAPLWATTHYVASKLDALKGGLGRFRPDDVEGGVS